MVAGKGENGRPGEGENIASAYRKAGPYIDASWQLMGSMLAGTFLGWWLDKKLGTSPWILLAGAMFGIGTGFYLFFKILMNIGKGTK